MTTAQLTEDIIMAASERGHLLVRNNSGVARFKRNGKPYVVRYGVGPVGGGGGDLIGLTKDGIFLSIEVKFGKDRVTEKQKLWITWVTMRNGRAGVARSVDDAIKIMEG